MQKGQPAHLILKHIDVRHCSKVNNTPVLSKYIFKAGIQMLFSKHCKYAIRGLTELARFPEGHLCSIQQLSKTLNVPPASLSKSFQPLAKHGFLTSVPGRYGGFSLSRHPKEITLYELKSLLEHSQLGQNTTHFFDSIDSVHAEWQQLQIDIEKFLKAMTIADLHQSLFK